MSALTEKHAPFPQGSGPATTGRLAFAGASSVVSPVRTGVEHAETLPYEILQRHYSEATGLLESIGKHARTFASPLQSAGLPVLQLPELSATLFFT